MGHPFLSAQYLSILLFLISNFTSAQIKLYPDLTSDFKNDLVFVSDSTGYLVDNAGSVYQTTDKGMNWFLNLNRNDKYFKKISFLDEQNGFILAAQSEWYLDSELYYTNNYGKDWEVSDIGLGYATDILPISNSKILRINDFTEILYLDNFYSDWTKSYSMPMFFDIDVYSPYGSLLYFEKLPSKRLLVLGHSETARNYGIISDSVSFILQSTNEGVTWDTLWCDLPAIMKSISFANDSIGWIAGEKSKILKTTNGGKTWIQYYEEISGLFDLRVESIFAINKDKIWAINNINEILHSIDGGITWEKTTELSQNYELNKIKFINETTGFIYGNNFLITNDEGKSWHEVSKSLKNDFKKIQFINENIGWAVGNLGILNTTDCGNSWNIQHASENQYFLDLFIVDSLEGWALSFEKLYHTINGGKSWISSVVVTNHWIIRGITFLNKMIGVIYEIRDNSDNLVYNLITFDGGKNWEKYYIHDKSNPQISPSSFLKMKFSDKDHLWFAGQEGVWLSTDTAKTWQLFDNIVPIGTPAFDFADSLYGWITFNYNTLAYTKDGCKTWEYIDMNSMFQPTDVQIIGRTMQGNLIYVTGYDGNVHYVYEENGECWQNSWPTYTRRTINDICVFIKDNRPHIWCVGDGSIVFYRLSEYLVTDINDPDLCSLSEFSLSQNYPNPFNPTTVIKYQVPSSQVVLVKVFDILGREITTLVNEYKAPGEYEVEFDGSELSSGVYFYRLTAGKYFETRKMILLE